MRLKWFAAALPAGLGVVVAVFAAVAWMPNPILYLRADLGTLSLVVGLLISGLAGGFLYRGVRLDRRYQRTSAAMRVQAAVERRRFLRRLDHELKNPLTAIRAGLTNVLDDSATAEQRQALASVEAQVVRLSRLTADLRKLAELETRSLELSSVNVADLLKEAVALAREQPDADARRLTLTLPQAPWPLPSVSADWDLIFLAVYNLLDNALKFSRPGDTVEVRAFESGASVSIEVADTGPGIPQDELPHVGEELYRGRGARGVPGSGLGLALVTAIVDRHGGRLSLRSRADQGTVVTLHLPVR